MEKVILVWGAAEVLRWCANKTCKNRRRSLLLTTTNGASGAAKALGRALDALLRLRQVGEHELELDRLDVAQRVDAAAHVDHVLVVEAAHDVHDHVDLREGERDGGLGFVARAIARVD